MKVRAYTLAVHVGHAPCWMDDKSEDRELLTLANCKPLIRNVAGEGEWIAAVTPNPDGAQTCISHAGQGAISRLQYWKRYKHSRFDSIYRPTVDGGWKQLKNPWHSDQESFTRDLISNRVLLSELFYMFANSYSKYEKSPRGLKLPERYSALARGGMRNAGHFIEMPNSFLSWIEKQPRLKLGEFQILGEFGVGGCGCCKE